jgi:hypothetical protein
MKLVTVLIHTCDLFRPAVHTRQHSYEGRLFLRRLVWHLSSQLRHSQENLYTLTSYDASRVHLNLPTTVRSGWPTSYGNARHYFTGLWTTVIIGIAALIGTTCHSFVVGGLI